MQRPRNGTSEGQEPSLFRFLPLLQRAESFVFALTTPEADVMCHYMAVERDKVELPELTHLQFLVLSVLGGSVMKGKELRDLLRQSEVNKDGPGFYQMMSRLEDAGMVEGWYTHELVAGHAVKERNYRVTSAGRSAWISAQSFYESLSGAASAMAV